MSWTRKSPCLAYSAWGPVWQTVGALLALPTMPVRVLSAGIHKHEPMESGEQAGHPSVHHGGARVSLQEALPIL